MKFRISAFTLIAWFVTFAGMCDSGVSVDGSGHDITIIEGTLPDTPVIDESTTNTTTNNTTNTGE